MSAAGPEPQRVCDARVDGGRDERPVEERDQGERHAEGCTEDEDLPRTDREDVAEEDGGHVGGEAAGLGDDDHAGGQHPHEQEPDARVVREDTTPTECTNPEAHGGRRCRRAHDRRSAHETGHGHSGEHPVTERLAEERHSADDDPCPHEGAERGDEHAAEQGSLHEVDGEGGEQPGHEESP